MGLLYKFLDAIKLNDDFDDDDDFLDDEDFDEEDDFEEEKPKPYSPKDFEIIIPFLNSSKKVKFKCPKCNKEFTTMANSSKDKAYIECEIKFCSNCGQEFNWRIDNE